MRDVQVTVLGTAQDGGFPQPGCARECCQRVRSNGTLRRYPVSLGIVGIDGSTHLIEASRSMGEQFEIWHSIDPIDGPLGSLSITHAHLGHIDGLGLFGKEVMGVKHLTVHCSESVASLIESNPLWRALREEGAIIPTKWNSSGVFEPSPGCGFSIRPIPVPHRDELTDNHALLIEGPGLNLLFMPDHDSWNETLCGLTIRQWLSGLNVDIALLDGTFWSENELQHRDMTEIPHPTVSESLRRLGGREAGDPDIRFLHLNHTNPLCNPFSQEVQELTAMGWGLVREGDSFTLERL
jgi:pyrroloquinoline quinone biosynthesis protein B